MAEAPRLSCVCLTGPTASGKTELAIELATRIPVEIVSMDSAMVYRGLDIGTAKPTHEMRAAVPHHLIDIADPADAYSAGRFARDAAEAIRDIQTRGRLPLLVGGTLLYLRALRDGLAPLPRADAAIRKEIEDEAAEVGWGVLHDRLRGIDPEAAARVAPADRQRIQRALEVHRLTGRALTDLQRERAVGEAGAVDVLTVAVVPPDRAALAHRIETRFDSMVEAGFVAEVEALRGRGDLTPELPALRAVGYRQVWGYLEGHYDWRQARSLSIHATRQFAKRQFTWLRSENACECWDAFQPALAQRFYERVERWRAGAA